jgi:hypothetical protein
MTPTPTRTAGPTRALRQERHQGWRGGGFRYARRPFFDTMLLL